MLNLAVILRESAAARPDAPALLHDGGVVTYAQLDARSDAVAAALAVKAFVVPVPGRSVTAEQVVDYCRERLAAYKYPRLVEFRETLPLTASGKVAKKELT